MSEESRAQEKPEAPKSWASGPLMEKLSLSVDPAKFFEWPDRATMQRIEELQRATQPWSDLMSPTIATLNEINQRAADAAGEVNRILEQQAKLFQFELIPRSWSNPVRLTKRPTSLLVKNMSVQYEANSLGNSWK